MDDDTLFIIRDPEFLYSVERVKRILEIAESQGHPLEKGSYLEAMTVRQLDALNHGKTDA